MHAHTFGNLIHADYRVPACDCADLFKVIDALTRNHADKLRAFRRMVFNVAAHNRDDHAKNFAFVMDPDGSWSLSPAYDLTYAPGPGGEHTMTVLGGGRRTTAEHCRRLARQLLIRDREAKTVFDEVGEVVAKWPQWADQAGCTKKTAHQIARQLVRL